MNDQKRKSPYSLAAGTGSSQHIHQYQLVNDTYRNMISDNPLCEKFCIEVLERFDLLLEKFSPNSNPSFNGHEVDVFIALVNLEKSIESQAVQS
jgi:hypothetical protein